MFHVNLTFAKKKNSKVHFLKEVQAKEVILYNKVNEKENVYNNSYKK